MRLKSFVMPAMLAVAGIAAIANCVSAASFIADVVANDGAKKYTAKIYIKENKARQQSVFPAKDNITIVRADKGVTWIIDPASKTYLELKSARLCPLPTDSELRRLSSAKSLGTKNVCGYPCRGTVYTPKSKDPNVATLTTWYSDKLHWPLISVYKTKQRTFSLNYINIKETKPAESLFTLPKGLKKREIPGGTPPVKSKPKFGNAPKK